MSNAPSYFLFLPQMRMSADSIVERALAAEAAGFEGMAFMDHMVPPLAADQDMWDAMALAGWVLGRTTRLQVGHLVLCDAFRHPTVLARQVTSLDHFSGGRFELGIGWGSVPEEMTAFGIGSTVPRDRVDRFEESIAIMRALWAGETVDHKGRYFTLEGASQRPLPTRHIPITIGGVGERTLGLVRDHADWWNIPVHHLHRIDRLRGRVGEKPVSIQTMVLLVPSEAERAELTAKADRRFGGTILRTNLVLGTVPELTEHFARLRSEGIDRFYIWFANFAPVETLQQFSEVIAATAR